MEATKPVLRKDTCLPLLGPCMLIFAVPLLIPGLTLTLVALWDETGFSKFSILHVLGIVLLVCSGLLLLLGLILNFTLTKKTKGRVSPQDEEKGSIFSSSSQGSDTMGYVQSTHHGRAPSHTASIAKVPTLLTDHQATKAAPPDGQRAEEDTLHASPLATSPSCSPGRPLTPGHLPPLTSAASRTLQEGSRADRPLENGAESYLTADSARGGGYSSERPSSCNYMLSESEDEEVQAAQYAVMAATLMSKDKAEMKTTPSISSSGLSSEQSSREASEVEDDPSHLDRKLDPSTLPDYRTAMADHRTEEVHSSPDHAASSSSSFGDQSSINNKGRQREVYQSDDDDSTNVVTERLFVTRQQAAGYRHGLQDHTSDSGEENAPHSENVSRPSSILQENSNSSSLCTESPSHGTYSVRSFVSEELAVKASPEELCAVEDPSFQFLAESTPEVPLSVSPVPLKIDRNRDWKDLGITVLGSRSGASSQNSPGKREGRSSYSSFEKQGSSSHSSPQKHSCAGGNLHVGSISEDDAKQIMDTDHSKRKKKRKKKKKRRERLKASHSPREEVDKTGEGWLAVEEREATSHRVSSLKSSRSPQHHPEHHVHWPDEQDISRLDTVPSGQL